MTIDNETKKPIFCLSHVIKSADPKTSKIKTDNFVLLHNIA